MAEDEGAKTDGDPTDPTKPPTIDAAHSAPPPSRPDTEWTASDSRGPMAAAEETARHEQNFGSAEPTDDPAHLVAEEPAPHTAAPPAPQATAAHDEPDPVLQKRSSLPILAGLLAGAAIGAIVALLVYRGMDQGGGSDPQIAALSAKVAALEAKPDPDASLKTSIADVQAKVAALQSKVGDQATSAPPAFDPGPLQQKVEALGAGIAALKTQGAAAQGLESKLGGLDSKVGSLETAVGGLQKQAATNGSGLQAIQDQQKSLAGKVGAPALAVVADSLVQAIAAGRPYAMQVDALGSLGADPAKLAVLKQNAQAGVPSAKVLAAKFAPLEEPMLATEHKAPPNASFLERMQSGMSSLVSVSKTDDLSGKGLSSQVARIDADLAHNDLTDAVATWAALPADAKAKSDAWGALAKTSAEAMTAAQGLQSDAIASLGGKKS